jgi:prepilin-type N-terminal cleavage/methylation domain-containing protein
MVRGILRGERGFTLLELTVVVLILGILIAIVVGSFLYSQKRATEVADEANLRVIRLAIERYRTDATVTAYPPVLEDLYPRYVSSRSALVEPERHMEYVYDPNTGTVYDPLHPER